MLSGLSVIVPRPLTPLRFAKQERTLVLIKPDGVEQNLTGSILNRFYQKGLNLVGLKMKQLSTEEAKFHLKDKKDKPFFNKLIAYMISGPVVIMAFEGENAIKVSRKLIGFWHPAKARPGTIRGDMASPDLWQGMIRNVIHGSDCELQANDEIAQHFQPDELVASKNH